MKYYILLIALLISASCSQIKESGQENVPEIGRPNIILFVSDDHGTDAIGAYGNPVIQTPNMDKLAEEGVRFTNAYCTSASCAASRSVILTGKFGHATGSYGHTHDYHHFSTFPDVKSLPVLLDAVGYHTARIGKYHLAPESVYDFNTVLEDNERSTVTMANKCKEVIDSKEPFFLYFCTGDPHRGNPFKPDPWDAPNNFGNRPEGYEGVEEIIYRPEDVIVPDFLPDTKQCREELAQYYQSVSRIDKGIGQLNKLLAEAGKLDNTIFIYISDNGIAFPGAKTTLYEPGIKLPCIIKDPSKDKKGIVNNTLVSWVDLTPTILDMAKAEFDEESFHGVSFANAIVEEDASRQEVYASHTFHEITMYYPMRSIRSGDYKLIFNTAYQLEYPFASDLWASSTWQAIYRNGIETYGKRKVHDYLQRSEFELYDLANDPDEITNLALVPEKEELLENMKQKLKEYQLRTRDPWIIMWDHDASMQGTGTGL
ncbi:sulfatase family protein [Reichenbachiella versicolor]|uniref:sulfatase family protein n=1 Tax=Reichenbachiella versicolor TaxID=1821036 RepID=UPI001C8814A5|nr:sulfatase [Reichenbachiella versicolor]